MLIDFRLLEMQRLTEMTTPVDLENTWTFNLISRWGNWRDSQISLKQSSHCYMAVSIESKHG